MCGEVIKEEDILEKHSPNDTPWMCYTSFKSHMNICHRCGMKVHCSRTCNMPKQLAKFSKDQWKKKILNL